MICPGARDAAGQAPARIPRSGSVRQVDVVGQAVAELASRAEKIEEHRIALFDLGASVRDRSADRSHEPDV
jgi:hypothetical protein